MSELDRLADDVEAARGRYLSIVRSLTARQGRFRPAGDVWSAAENTEHLVHAEQGGVYGMWSAMEGIETGRPVWEGEPIHRGKSIEQIVSETWQEREQVPASAAPTWGGPLAFWIASLEANRHLLESLRHALLRHPLEEVHYPHPISGPLDLRQRFEFLRFHTDRHRAQVERLMRHPDFPGAEVDDAPEPRPT